MIKKPAPKKNPSSHPAKKSAAKVSRATARARTAATGPRGTAKTSSFAKEPITPDVIELKTTTFADQRQYLKSLGRRKEAVAQVKLYPVGQGDISVNGRPLNSYFSTALMREIIINPLKLAGRVGQVDLSMLVRGGGVRGQAEAAALGISRALVKLDETLRRSLKKSGFLTRDARVKERKKYGLKKARRAPQWAKR